MCPWAAARPGPCRHPPAPRPGPTTPLIPVPTPNFARNSPTTISNFEFRSLELQRFRTSLKLQPIELRATFPEATRGNTMLPPTSTAAWPKESFRPRARPHRHPPEPRPGPLAPLTPVPTPNFACNSPTTLSNFEFQSLELQRFQTSLKLHPIELHASFLEATPYHHPPAPQPGPPHRSLFP